MFLINLQLHKFHERCYFSQIADVTTREPLGPYENGEVCIKGPLILKDYIGHDKNNCLDSDGFFRTGDVGYYDEEKYVYIVDRMKELIKYKAYQVNIYIGIPKREDLYFCI